MERILLLTEGLTQPGEEQIIWYCGLISEEDLLDSHKLNELFLKMRVLYNYSYLIEKHIDKVIIQLINIFKLENQKDFIDLNFNINIDTDDDRLYNWTGNIRKL